MTTITQAITPLPAVPDPATDTPTEFSTKGAAFVLAQKAMAVELETFRGQANTVAGEVNTNASTATTKAGEAADSADSASTSATTATTQAGIATTQAAAASASAASAAAIAGAFVGTSTTSLAIGTGSKSFTTQAGEQYSAGIWMTAVSQANPANFMFGQVTSYSGTTLIIDVQATGGSGTHADWNLSLTGARGAQGEPGALAGNATGNISMVDQQLSRAMLLDCGLTVLDKGNINNATVTFDYTAGSVQTYTATGSTVTWAFSNWPPTGNLGELLVIATNAGAYTHSITGITWILPSGVETTSIATYLAALTGRTALQTSGKDQFYLWTRDAGGVVYGKLL